MRMSRSDVVALVVFVLAVLAVPALFWTRLPEPVATHFGIDGRPNGYLSRVVWLVIMALALALVWGVFLGSRSNAPLTWRGPFAFGAVGVLVVAQLSIVWSNLDVPLWRDARPVNVPLLMVAIAVSWAALAAVAHFLERA